MKILDDGYHVVNFSHLQIADFGRLPTEMEIEFARHYRYDGLKAKTNGKLKKGRFSTSREFVGGSDSEVDSDSSAKNDNEELHSSAKDTEEEEEESGDEEDADPWAI